MKTRYIYFSTVLTVVLTLVMFGQVTHSDTTKTAMKHHPMANKMGKPIVDATVEELHMKVWLMTQKHHKKMMKEMNHKGKGIKDSTMTMNEDMKGMEHDGMKMDKSTREAMMAGTHCMMLDITDAASGKEITNAGVNVLIVSPSKKNSSVDLKPMMSHFGNGLTLDEKGKYQMTVSVKVGGVSKTKEFEYAVK